MYPGSTLGAGNLSRSNQPPRSTQPGHPSVGRHNEYQPKGGDALRLGSKGRYGSCFFLDPLYNTCNVIPERFTGVAYIIRHYGNPRLLNFTSAY